MFGLVTAYKRTVAIKMLTSKKPEGCFNHSAYGSFAHLVVISWLGEANRLLLACRVFAEQQDGLFRSATTFISVFLLVLADNRAFIT